MRRLGRWLWPRGLAGRLIVMLVVAMLAAQTVLSYVVRDSQHVVVEGMIHGQTMALAVTLTRLVAFYPPSEAETLVRAFGSRASCAIIDSTAPIPHPMSDAERQLAGLLKLMLHGIEAGEPQVSFERFGPRAHPCEIAGASDEDHETPLSRVAVALGIDHDYTATVALAIPLDDGRWLTVRSGLPVPTAWNRMAVLAFGLTLAAIIVMVVFTVRWQTRSLRLLADSAERFGRGETVGPVREFGPGEVVSAIRAFNTMQERLSRFVHDRLKLLGSISHDLRTPLTTLRLKAEFIDDDDTRDGIVATIDELTTIAEATLAFTRAEATSEETKSIDLGALVAEVAEGFQLGDRPVSVEPAPELPYACRPVSLKRAVRNLVENALRYGGCARVRIERDGGMALIIVDDDGPGIPVSRVEEAFQPFVRLEESRSVETGGIGLGLSIARSIVKAHGGTLTLTNRPEGGLHAVVALPLG